MSSDICQLLEKYSNLVLAVMADDDSDPLWHKFYRIQMANYLLGQKNFSFELTSVFVVYNLIHNSWLNLKDSIAESVIPIKNYDSIFMQTKIDFPVDEDTVLEVPFSSKLLKQF